MANKPKVQDLNANSAQILNAIRNSASPEYRAAVPIADPNTDSVRSIGKILMDYQPFRNEFLYALINRIGRVVLSSKLYDNPWAVFKKGLLDYGESIEEIFVELAKPHDFDPSVAENEIFKREIPDVLSAFHVMNYQKFYKVTISNDQLRTAFLSWNGITNLIGRIVNTLYTGANYDEFQVMKYLIARLALDGGIAAKTISAVSAANAKEIVSTIKGVSNNLEFMSDEYNMAGVKTYTNKEDQFIILTSAFDATIDVEVLASAFNMDKAQFMGNRILVDSFADIDTERLGLLFAKNPAYVPFTAAELTQLATIPAVILDRDWMQVYDNFFNFTQQYNGEGLYWNYWYHAWKTFSASPFNNAVLFTTLTNTLTALTVSPATATVNKGSVLQMSVKPTGTGFSPAEVEWSVTGGSSAQTIINSAGLLVIGDDETAASLTVKATSKAVTTVSGTATITVAGNEAPAPTNPTSDTDSTKSTQDTDTTDPAPDQTPEA